MGRRHNLWLIGILGLAHAYVGWRLLPDLPVAPLARVAGAAWLAVSFALMVGGLNARAIRRRELSDVITAAGLTATGLLSSIFVLTVLRDLLLLALIVPFSTGPFQLIESVSASAVVALALLVTGVGHANARRRAGIVIVEVPVADLPQGLDGFTIAQVSDVHIGRTIKRNYVDAVVRAVNDLDADLIAGVTDFGAERFDAARAGFDVPLSGHTHGGQFWPWRLFVRLQQPYTAGLRRLERLWMCTSRGTGYWGPPKRLGAPSEITLLRLVSHVTGVEASRARTASPRALTAHRSLA
jgi:hypothetical protein